MSSAINVPPCTTRHLPKTKFTLLGTPSLDSQLTKKRFRGESQWTYCKVHSLSSFIHLSFTRLIFIEHIVLYMRKCGPNLFHASALLNGKAHFPLGNTFLSYFDHLLRNDATMAAHKACQIFGRYISNIAKSMAWPERIQCLTELFSI